MLARPRRFAISRIGWWVAGCALAASSCGPAAVPAGPPPAVPPASGPSASPTTAATPNAAPATASTAEPAADQPAAPTKLNVVVITIDAMRADMPWAGYPRDIAPNLTRLESESVSYTRAYSLSSYTAMSMGGFLAGRYPGELHRSGYFFSAYPDSELFFPEILQQAGVRTLAAHAHYYFDQKAGFRQGFDDYRMVDGLDVNNTTDKNVTSPQHLALAEEILSDPANTKGPFFAWFHFMDPHDRYMSHEGHTLWGSGGRDRYDGEIHFTDAHVGKLLRFIEAQPWGKRTAIIVKADHGEAFGEHKQTRHGFELWEPLVHVPLFIRVPGVTPRRIEQPRSQIDLAPTILDLLGVAAPATLAGVSLLPEIRGETEPPAREVIIDLPRTSDNFRRRAMVSERYKIIAFGDDFRFELYDVIDDPGERVDLRHRKREVYEQMKKRYLELVKQIHDVCPDMRHKLKGKRPENPC